ncbi:MAG TPA: regulator of G-protein signaling domain-containing protein, partial [Gemmatirosa sp.]
MPVDSATLRTILGTPSYYRQFRAFAEREYNVENLDFLEAAAAYRRSPSKTRAIAILDRFVKENSASQVNISFTQREDVLTATSGYEA